MPGAPAAPRTLRSGQGLHMDSWQHFEPRASSTSSSYCKLPQAGHCAEINAGNMALLGNVTCALNISEATQAQR